MMAKRQQNVGHTFAGQREGEQLVEWLNRNEPPRIGATREEPQREARTRKRIAQLISDLDQSAEAYIHDGSPDAALNRRIDTELARHTLRVKVVHPQEVGEYKAFAAPKWTFDWYSSAGSRAAEMILTIVRLDERGLLARVRKCGAAPKRAITAA
jgi:hypothetical protein